MTLPQLKAILDILKRMPENIPDEHSVQGLFNQSMVVGVDASIAIIKKSDAWIKTVPYLRNAIVDIPIAKNSEIYGQILSTAELFWPTFISSVAKSSKKKTYLMKLLTNLIEEVRDVSTN